LIFFNIFLVIYFATGLFIPKLSYINFSHRQWLEFYDCNLKENRKRDEAEYNSRLPRNKILITLTVG